MATFELQGQDGKTYEVEAPDAESAVGAFKQFQPKNEPRVGPVEAAVQGVGQGATFGFMDELAGAGLAAVAKATGSPQSFGDLYNMGVKIPRAAQNAAAEQQPIPYYGGQIAAGVAPAIATGGAGAVPNVARAGLGARTAAGALEGGIYGSLFGAGSAEGGLENRAIGAGVGFAGGAAAGAVLPAAVDTAGAAFRGLAAPIRGMLAPRQFGQQKVAEALMRDRNPDAFAGRGAQGAINDLERLQGETGKPLMLADMGGENTRNLLRSAANMASTGTQRLNRTLDARQGNQWRRIERDMGRGIGSPDDYAASVDQIVAERAANASDDFAKAYDAPWNVRADDPLVPLLQRPYMQRVLEKTSESVEGTTGTTVTQMRPWELLHRVRMQIDREINGLKSGTPDSKANWDANDLLQLKREFDDAVTRNNPKFKEAINRYSGDSALKGAAQDGFDDALRIPTEDLARKMRSFKNESERDMYRMGAARAIAGKVRRPNVTSDRTENIFSSPDIQMRLRAIFPDNKSLREFQRDLVLEARMADTRKAVQGNSSTAKQLAQAQESAAPVAAVNALANAATGRLEPLMNMLSRGANRFSGLSPSTANAVIDAGMTRGGNELAGEIQNALMRAETEPLRRAVQTRGYNAGVQSGIGAYNNRDQRR